MSLLVSPLANLIGDGAAAENGDYLDFMQIDENTYSRTFLFLKAQRTIIQGISDQIHTINNTKKDDHIAINSKIEGLTQKLLESSFGEVFENAKDAIPIIRNIINREDDLNINEKKISQKLLSSSIALSRVFSIIASSLPTCSKCENSKDAKDQKNEHNYVPDLNDVLVLCRICEEYVPLSQIEEHSKICVKAAESEVKIMSLDDRISKLQNSIKKIILRGASHGLLYLFAGVRPAYGHGGRGSQSARRSKHLHDADDKERKRRRDCIAARGVRSVLRFARSGASAETADRRFLGGARRASQPASGVGVLEGRDRRGAGGARVVRYGFQEITVPFHTLINSLFCK